MPERSPPLVSMGQLCHEDGYCVEWSPYANGAKLTSPDGTVIHCECRDGTPMIHSTQFRVLANAEQPGESQELDDFLEEFDAPAESSGSGDLGAIAEPPPLPLPIEAPPAADSNPSVVTEYLRRSA